MSTYLNIQNKIFTQKEFSNKINTLKATNKKIVFTNGCFDLIHLGHIYYLSKASELADFLIIGLNSDNSVRKIKGKNRPIKDEKSRAMILASFSFVNYVVLFDEKTPYDLIKIIKPNILVKGNDYKKEEIVGFDIVTKNKGEIITIDFLEGHSTTLLEKKCNIKY